jgi:hypothetical protein
MQKRGAALEGKRGGEVYSGTRKHMSSWEEAGQGHRRVMIQREQGRLRMPGKEPAAAVDEMKTMMGQASGTGKVKGGD